METETRVVVSPPQGKITSRHDNPSGDHHLKIATENPALAIGKEVIETIADSGITTLTKVMGEASKVADEANLPLVRGSRAKLRVPGKHLSKRLFAEARLHGE